MIVEVVEELAVLDLALLEPGAVVSAELLQRLLDADRLDLTHAHKRTEGVSARTRKPTMTSAFALIIVIPNRWR